MNYEEIFEKILRENQHLEEAEGLAWTVLDPQMNKVKKGLSKQEAYNFINAAPGKGFTMGIV